MKSGRRTGDRSMNGREHDSRTKGARREEEERDDRRARSARSAC